MSALYCPRFLPAILTFESPPDGISSEEFVYLFTFNRSSHRLG